MKMNPTLVCHEGLEKNTEQKRIKCLLSYKRNHICIYTSGIDSAHRNGTSRPCGPGTSYEIWIGIGFKDKQDKRSVNMNKSQQVTNKRN